MEPALHLALQLPFGILTAALLLEIFVLMKDRQELEPAVLWLLFMGTGVALLGAGAILLLKGTKAEPALYFTAATAGAGALATIAFFFKRMARNRGVLRLSDRWLEPGSNLPMMRPGQQFFILGFRTAAVFAVAAAAFGALQVSRVVGKSFAAEKSLASEEAKETSNTTVVADAGNGTPTPADPNAPAPEAPPAVVADNGATATPAPVPVPAPESPTPPAPTENPGAPPMVAETTPAVPPTPPGADPANPATPVTTPAPVTPVPAPAPTPTPAMDPATPVTTPVPTLAADSRQVSKNSIFAQKIRPILSKHCVSCHGSQKQKADLRLDTPEWIRKGRDGKAVLLAGKPDQSTIYSLTTKPMDDDDRMPPAKSGNGLSKAEQELLKNWILAGADMGDGVSTASSGAVKFATDDLAASLPKPDAAVVETLTKAHIKVRPISANGHLLELDLSNADLQPDNMMLDQIAAIGPNIHKLDLSRTRVADTDLVHLAKMPNISALLLSRTQITDAGIAHLAGLQRLELLNLYQAPVTDASIATLSNLKSLKKLYAWQSQITPAGVARLKQALPQLDANMGE